MIKEAIGADLRRLRVERKLSQESLAHNADIGLTFLKEIEAGQKQPTATTLFKLSLALDITPDKLILPAFKKWRTTQR